MFLVCLTKLNAFEPIDLNPLHFVYFTILRTILRLLVRSIIRCLGWETVRHRRDADYQRSRIGSARRTPHKRLRLVLLLGPTRRHGPRHPLSFPLYLLPTGKRRDLLRGRTTRFGRSTGGTAGTGSRWSRIRIAFM